MDIPQLLKILKIIFFAIPWLLSILSLHQFLYNKYPKYYFFVAKKFKKWRDTKWKLSVIYQVKKSEDFFSEFDSILEKNFSSKRRIFNLKNKKQYEFSDYSLTVQYDLECSQTDYVNVELLFGNITATHHTTKDKLLTLRQFFTDLEKKISFENQNYSMKIFFIKMKNPFYGLMIQRLGEEHVKYFECRFPITTFTKKHFDRREDKDLELTVYKDFISLNNESFDTVEQIALKCLILE